jgi:DNA mismatch repair protein MutS
MDNAYAQTVSLLWPEGSETAAAAAKAPALRHDRAAIDLGLDGLAGWLSIDMRYSDATKTILATLCDQPDVIRYRHDVLDDFLNCPGLAGALEAQLSALTQLGFISDTHRARETQLHQAVARLGELELYVECVKQFRQLLVATGEHLRSTALCRLRDLLIAREADPSFQALAAELPALGAEVRNIRSVTIGINLDPQLLPVEATLLSISAQRFKGPSSSLLGRLLGAGGKGGENSDDYQGIAQLHSVPSAAMAGGYTSVNGQYANPLLVPLFKDLNDVLETVSKPVLKALTRYIRHNGQFLTALEPQIAFYLGAAKLIARIRAAGLPVCRPEVLPAADRICEVTDAYNINLALRLLDRQPGADLSKQVITNDIAFGDAGRIFILTGPNQGGKTTYTQSAGLLQVLCQAGMYVPGSSARISPVDRIFTHFPVEERPSLEAGRLGEEVKRLGDIFTRATRHSLVLLNESLSSTSPGEGLYLARDVVRALKLLGARVIFATHLHELAAGLDVFNAAHTGDSMVVSLVARSVKDTRAGASVDADVERVRRTYKIQPGPPEGLSYAHDIAARYGLSFDQLEKALHDRGVIGNGP